ncbi:MAG: ABC transporter permease [Chloroflexi bacterium]|nr:ABC transporter permease [Chloroflexota bacterium]
MTIPNVSNDQGAGHPVLFQMSRAEKVGRFMLNNGLLIALLAEIAIFALLIPIDIFFSQLNIINILRMSAGVGILGIFYAVAIIAGVIDLGYLGAMSLAGLILGTLFQIAKWPLSLACLAALVVLMLVEGVNILLITRIRVTSIIATIATSILAVGLSYLIMFQVTKEGYLRIQRLELQDLADFNILGVPAIIPLFVITFIFVYIVMNETKLGAHLYAIGGNAQAAQLNGISRSRLTALVLMGVAIGAWITTIYVLSRTLYAQVLMGSFGASTGAAQGTAFVRPDPLIACLFAGIALFGGVGRVERLLLAILFLAVMVSGMGILNVSASLRVTVDGLAFVFAVLLESVRQRIESR